MITQSLMQKLLCWKREARGQAVVEAALIIPMLLILLMGIVLMGFWLNAKQIVTAAAREGARAAATTGDIIAGCNAVALSMQVLDTKHYVMSIDADGSKSLPLRGKPFFVIVKYDLQLGFKFFQSAYEKDNPGKPYPFTSVTGQAAARMELDAIDGKTDCTPR